MPRGEWEFSYRRIRPSSEEAELKRNRMEKWRRDHARGTALKALGVKPRAFFNYYNCESCQLEWAEECEERDDETFCQNCNQQRVPFDSQELYDDEDETPTNNGD